MSQHLAELCRILIQNTYGELTAQIFSALAEHGRLTLPSLAQHSKLSSRRVRRSLTILLEQRVVQRHAPLDRLPPYYQVEWRNAYNTVRQDNLVTMVKRTHGDNAGRIVAYVLQLGHARIADLAPVYKSLSGSKRDSGIDALGGDVEPKDAVNGKPKVNGVKTPSISQPDSPTTEFHSTVRTLLRAGVLVKVSKRTYIPFADLKEQMEEVVTSEHFPDGKVTGPKKQVEFTSAVNRLKRRWREEDEYSDTRDLGSHGTTTVPHLAPNKRAKTNGDAPKGHVRDADVEEWIPMLSDDLIVSVDYSKCTLALRSVRLQQMARRFLGGATSAVYGALLQSLEGQCRIGRDETSNEELEDAIETQPVANLNHIAEILGPDVELTTTIQGLASSPPPEEAGKRSKEPHAADDDEHDFTEIGIKQETVSDSEDEPTTNGFTSYRDRNRRLAHIEAHLLLLEEHPKAFCHRVRRHGGQNEWGVDFPRITQTLVQAEIDTMIHARYGRTALRIVRMLREKGKLEEKQMAAGALLRVKEMRALLSQLQFHGVLEAQELPRDNARQPSRTIFLWYIDEARLGRLFLHRAYQAMARLLQRAHVERARFKPVIAKANRSDVKGREHERLEANERLALRQWREAEERLLAQVARMDDVVAVLRDFNGSLL